MTTPAELESLAAAASAAFTATLGTPDVVRAGWLTAIADALDAERPTLVAIADDESRLGETRLGGELTRTTSQLRLFAAAIVEGSYLEATIDHARSDTAPPSIDLRRMLRPTGPVAVFGASNFPFAFSVAGGDTASALAVGCPVIAKAHPAHPRLSRAVAAIVIDALRSAGAPNGTFGIVDGVEAGSALVQHPVITAVGFTGSQRGGRALFDLAAGRHDPIPFYGELSAMNPVLITATALAARGAELARGLVDSFTLGAGQFCTKPGLVLVPAQSGFADLVREALGEGGTVTMLTPDIAGAFAASIERLTARGPITVAAGSPAAAPDRGARAVVLQTTATELLRDVEALVEESFGPATLLVEYGSVDEALAVVRAVGGTLTATLHAEPGDDIDGVVAVLSDVAGRVLFAGWPTGVLVAWAQHHGGPWPSTTSLHSSVGPTAMRRFLRPISFQAAPERALPPALRDDNPLGIPRRVDGVLRLA